MGVGFVPHYARESGIESSFIITKPTTAYMCTPNARNTLTVIISGPDLDADQYDQHWIKYKTKCMGNFPIFS